MAHTQRDKKLLNRVRRLRGQVEAVERAIEQGQECASVLQTLAACRGAINALLAEIIEGHVEHHLADAKGRLQRDAAEELMGVVRTYLK
ncbi:MAG TPA: metal/formaldehyde-sensitive transcriptional repressor [Myxococcales bacterium]|nr:metal/formaldehyde-sensitive transcriptional repressor [Myxococcales bacterium]